jgi:LacI family transcriptional regulator
MYEQQWRLRVLKPPLHAGWQLPGDLSVIGYSDSQYAAYLGLSTIDLPIRDVGREATRVLLGAIADPASAPRSIVLPTQLLVRRTCGPPVP